MKTAVLVISHGSREVSANREFVRLVGKYRQRHIGWKISHAFLELAEPNILATLGKLSVSSKEIQVLPLFFFTAKHVKKHIPEILRTFRESHPQVKVSLAKPL